MLTLKPEPQRTYDFGKISPRNQNSSMTRNALLCVPRKGQPKEVQHAHVQRTDNSPGRSAGDSRNACRALADRKVNILAFQSIPGEGTSLVRLVVDNPTTAKTVLDKQGLSYTETEVAQVKLAHRPGELARAASRLGDANININYAYAG